MPDAVDISRNQGARIWRNDDVPVVYRPGGGQKLLVRLPGCERGENIIWLRGERKRKITFNWQYRAWEIAPARFNDIVERCLGRYGESWVIQPYRSLEKCAPACWNAEGHVCECSCLGENHGSGRELDHVVNETFAFEWGDRRLAARLLKLRLGRD